MSNDEIKHDIDELEKKIDELIHQYDKFFLGIINVEPIALKNRVQQLIRKYATKKINNVMLNFKYNNLTSRYLTYQEYWNRNLRLIEEGKNPREIKRLEIKSNLFEKLSKPAEKQTNQEEDYKRLYEEYTNILTKKGKEPMPESDFIKKVEEIKNNIKSKFGETAQSEIKLEETESGIRFKSIVKKRKK